MGGIVEHPKITKTDIETKSDGMLHDDPYMMTTRWLGPVIAHPKDPLGGQVAIEADGIMVTAGPFCADDKEAKQAKDPAMTPIMDRVRSLKAARRVMDVDPMHAAGARHYFLRPWMVNQTTFDIRVEVASGTAAIRSANAF